MVHNMCDVIYRSTVDGKPELADGLEVVFLLDGSVRAVPKEVQVECVCV